MSVREFAEGLVKEIGQKKLHLTEKIANGDLTEPEYKALCGRIRAYKDIISIIEEHLERYEKS